MRYTNGNYEAFARPRKPAGVDDKSAYIVGAGLAGLAAAVFLIRDGQMKGEHIHIFEELDGNEGILVASKIADRVGITRSVIVNALRKFESAGVIESRSSGMKGTYIKVLNDVVFDELKAIKASNSNLK